jgi:uncharacterized protein
MKKVAGPGRSRDGSIVDPLNRRTGFAPTPLKEHAMATKIFVNLPVQNLDRTVSFFTKLGYSFNPQFTDENATCMIIADDIFVMLLVDTYFKTFTPKPIADAKKSTEVLVALSADSREAVDKIVNAALQAGARRYAEPKDLGFMYQWGFEDLDGHIWEYAWMDMSQMPK